MSNPEALVCKRRRAGRGWGFHLRGRAAQTHGTAREERGARGAIERQLSSVLGLD